MEESRRYFYNSSSKQCQEFQYGGCFGNENHFSTNDLCLKKCQYQMVLFDDIQLILIAYFEGCECSSKVSRKDAISNNAACKRFKFLYVCHCIALTYERVRLH